MRKNNDVVECHLVSNIYWTFFEKKIAQPWWYHYTITRLVLQQMMNDKETKVAILVMGNGSLVVAGVSFKIGFTPDDGR